MSLPITLERLQGLGLSRLFDAMTCRAVRRYPWQGDMIPEALAGIPDGGAIRYNTHYEMALHYKCPCGVPGEWLRLSFMVSSEMERDTRLTQDAVLNLQVVRKANYMAEQHEARARLREKDPEYHAQINNPNGS